MGKRKVFGIIGTLGVILSTGPITYAATLQQLQKEEKQAQLQLSLEQKSYGQTQNSLASISTQIQSLNKNLQSAQATLGSTTQKLNLTTSEINKTQTLLSATQAQLTSTQNQLATTEANYHQTKKMLQATAIKLATQSRQLDGQLRLIEEHGTVGYLSVLLGAHSFSDFISRASLLGQVASAAAHEVSVIKAEEAKQKQEKANLRAEAVTLSSARNALASHQTQLQAEQSLLNNERTQVLKLHQKALSQAQSVTTSLQTQAHLKTQLATHQAVLAQNMSNLNSQIQQLASQIQSLLSQYRGGGMSLHQLYSALLPLVTPIAQRFGLPPALVIAVITQESGGNASAASYAGAIGLMQIEPGTADQMAQKLNQTPPSIAQLENPQENVTLGCEFLSGLLSMYGGNVSYTLAAYNAGPGAVQQYGGIPPYAQTQQYVKNVEYYYGVYSAW